MDKKPYSHSAPSGIEGATVTSVTSALGPYSGKVAYNCTVVDEPQRAPTVTRNGHNLGGAMGSFKALSIEGNNRIVIEFDEVNGGAAQTAYSALLDIAMDNKPRPLKGRDL